MNDSYAKASGHGGEIFYAIALVASAEPTDKTYANQLKAGEILEALWAKQPDHPGLAHYIIHSYDSPALADKARAAAQRYATSRRPPHTRCTCLRTPSLASGCGNNRWKPTRAR